MIVRTATERDYPAIARIQEQAPEAAQWPLGDYSGSLLLVAEEDGKMTGFCAWRQTVPDEAEVLNIAVDPAWRRRGIGLMLLDALTRVAKGSIFLEVSVENQRAIGLYRKAGWESVAVRKGYYDGGKTDAIVMKKRSC